MKGIVLAGGAGTRLHPLTLVVSKQLLPVFDKPMVYYPLTTLMLAGVRDLLVISTPADLPRFAALLGDGAAWGVSFRYAPQPRPDGIAQALVIAREFVGRDPVMLILGDNIFHGDGLVALLRRAARCTASATIFGCQVSDPRRYGVADVDAGGAVTAIREKPAAVSPSSLAVTGLYAYPNDALDIAAALTPSARGELEISDVNAAFLGQGRLRLERLGRGTAWLDAGTYESLYAAASFIETVQSRQGLRVGCPEEVAFRSGWIDAGQLEALAVPLGGSAYGAYLRSLAAGGALAWS